MKRWVPIIDVVVFTALPALFTLAIVASLLFEQPWPPVKIAFAIGFPIVSWLTAVLILWDRWQDEPTYALVLGTVVWAKDIPVSKNEISDALHLYAQQVSKAHKRLDLQTTLAMLGQMRIELTKKPIWWAGSKKAGLQKGYFVRAHWGEGFGHNAFFHELHHAVDENLLGVAIDYKHERMLWWALVADIKRAWREAHVRS